MRVVETSLPGVLLLEPKVFADARGFFLETYHEERFRAAGIEDRFVQDNHSRSARGTVRGLHYQLHHAQAKLCRVTAGEVLDVAVDIRRGSPHFGQWVALRLSAEQHRQLFIPAGFAHGFAVLSESADFLYKCSDYYHPEDEHGIAWDDPALGIDWGVEGPIVSAKDLAHPRLADVPPERLPAFPG